jgi:hypothetical protein
MDHNNHIFRSMLRRSAYAENRGMKQAICRGRMNRAMQALLNTECTTAY